jgi:kynurenine formamidase
MDGFLIQPHGQLITHLDAPCHTVYDGTLFNGVPSSEALTPETALLGGVELATRGVLGRGVLLDVAALRGRPWLEDDEVILPEDLDACEQLHGVRVGRGDCLLVRTGYRARNLHGLRTGPDFKRPGLQAACLPWLHEREIGLLAADVAIDCMPHGYDSLGLPVHTVGMWAIGLWLLDNCWLEDLSQQCAAARRYEFLFAVSPLLLRGGTGSPVNPLAVF